MTVLLVTGSGGLVGSAAAKYAAQRGFDVVGVDNNMRETFFGRAAGTARVQEQLKSKLGTQFSAVDLDLRDRDTTFALLERHKDEVLAVIHAASQPSHEWSRFDPVVDFDVNATSTLNVLEATRRYSPGAAFVFCSTNKVYGDTVNRLTFGECETRWELPPADPMWLGVDESMSIDSTLHTLFGVSKLAADVLVQEYGRTFGLNTVCFRYGTITGPEHAAVESHGFLAYVVRCALERRPYTIFGYEGKQVRDVIHVDDVVAAIDAYLRAPMPAAIYNLGGGRESNCSVVEAISLVETATRRRIERRHVSVPRAGDHKWWISDNSRFRAAHPEWRIRHSLLDMIDEIRLSNATRWR